MEKKTLLKLSIIISLIGIIILYLISINIKLDPIDINEIDESFIGKSVKVQGVITSTASSDKITTIHIDNSKTSLTMFSKLELAKGTNIQALGKVDEYNNQLQIVVDELILT